jgi:hypothetical protein
MYPPIPPYPMALCPKHPFIAKGVTSKGCKNALISPLMYKGSFHSYKTDL